MKCNKECKYYTPFKNTEECNLCICRFNDDYLEVEYNGECIYKPKTLTCKDCTRLGTDFACMTADGDDPVNNCPGFIDSTQSKITNILYEKFINGYSKEKIVNILKVVEEFVEKEFKIPFEEGGNDDTEK